MHCHEHQCLSSDQTAGRYDQALTRDPVPRDHSDPQGGTPLLSLPCSSLWPPTGFPPGECWQKGHGSPRSALESPGRALFRPPPPSGRAGSCLCPQPRSDHAEWNNILGHDRTTRGMPRGPERLSRWPVSLVHSCQDLRHPLKVTAFQEGLLIRAV